MKRLLVSIVVAGLLTVAGCQSFNSSPGSGSVTTRQIDTFKDTKGIAHSVETTHTILLKQPANAEESATMDVKTNPDSTIAVVLSTGNSYNLGRIMAGNALLSPVIWAGIGLILLGAGIGVISKGTLLKPAIGVGVAGIILISMGYLLSQFTWLFMVGTVITIIAIIGYVLYSAKIFKDRDIAITETVGLVEHLKKNYMDANDREKEFKTPFGLAATTQPSPETRAVVQQVKQKIKTNAAAV